MQFFRPVMYFLYSSFPHSCYLHEEGETEREREAVLLLPITLSGCPVLTPHVSRLLSTGGTAFSLSTCPWEHLIWSSLDFDFQTLKPGCWVSFPAGPLTSYVSLGKLLNLSVLWLPHL